MIILSFNQVLGHRVSKSFLVIRIVFEFELAKVTSLGELRDWPICFFIFGVMEYLALTPLVSFLPRLVITSLSSAAEMKPLPSLSNTRKALRAEGFKKIYQ